MAKPFGIMDKLDRVNALIRFLEALGTAPFTKEEVVWNDLVRTIADELGVGVKAGSSLRRSAPAAPLEQVVTPDPLDELPNILTPQRIADYLGISRKRVYELTDINPEYGGIPMFKIGGSKRVEKRDLIEWIKRQKGRTE